MYRDVILIDFSFLRCRNAVPNMIHWKQRADHVLYFEHFMPVQSEPTDILIIKYLSKKHYGVHLYDPTSNTGIDVKIMFLAAPR